MSDDTVPFVSHITERRGVFQYIRRVPVDVADRMPIKRVQASLLLSVANWTAEDWQLAAEWYRLTRLHEDWRKRCASATGAQIASGRWRPDPMPKRDAYVRL